MPPPAIGHHPAPLTAADIALKPMRSARFAEMIASAVPAVLLCLCASAAHAAPRTFVQKGDGAAKIVTYDSLCDEDNAIECLVAEIGCSGPGDFTATVHNLNSKEAASVFAKANGKGSVAVGASRWVLQVSKVALSEHSYNWDVTATSLEKGVEIWRAIWGASEVQLQAGTRTVVLRRGDVEEGAFRGVVGICGAESR